MTWLALAGRGWGKTKTGSETVRAQVCGSTPLSGTQYNRIAIIAETAADARDVMIEGPSGLLTIHPKDFRPHFEPSKRRLTWPNGAVATLYNAVEPDQLRGPQHGLAWLDELAKWRYVVETWDNLQFGMRAGTHPRKIITTTPRPIPLLKQILHDPSTFVTRGSTYDNRANLAPSFFTEVAGRYTGTRLGRQELEAEILDDMPGALWQRAWIDTNRVKESQLPNLVRIVVAIDPAVSSDPDKSDETGIVCAGVDANGHGYVLDDLSGIMAPDDWAKKAVAVYHNRSADRIVAEINNGGEMITNTIRTIDPTVPCVSVTATRGKVVRAEPVSLYYEQGKVHHVGSFAKLEDQLCMFSNDVDRGQHGSPDRADACLAAGSMVATADGDRAIETIIPGDRVWTRKGLRRVLRAEMTSSAASTVTVHFSNKVRLRLTPGHPVHVDGKGFVAVDALVCDDIVTTCKSRRPTKGLKPAPASVVGFSEGRVEPVYNLQVEDEPEFYANGILVHNCVWALTELMVKQKRGKFVFG